MKCRWAGNHFWGGGAGGEGSTGLRREHTPTEQLQARLAKLDAEMDQFSRRMAADRAILLPTVSSSVSELTELQATMQRDLQRIDQKWLMQELASAHRARDYIRHVEMKSDPWTARTQFDAIAIASWIQNAERFFPALG